MSRDLSDLDTRVVRNRRDSIWVRVHSSSPLLHYVGEVDRVNSEPRLHGFIGASFLRLDRFHVVMGPGNSW